MPKMHVKRSITIDAPVKKVYEMVSNFNHWTAWSPWLIQDPEAKVSVSDDAKFYSWEGTRVGSGEMKVTSETAPNVVEYDLTFLKPWKSHAKVKFETIAEGDRTKATWHMDSALPFFMFWMKKSMEGYVGMDYERGLYLLKDLAECGKVHSTMEFLGTENFDGCNYIGVKKLVDMDSIDTSMQNDFLQLEKFFSENSDLQITGNPFSIYYKWDVVKKKVGYISAFPISTKPSTVPSEFVLGYIPSTRVNSIIHKGPYTQLGNAWSTQYSMHRNKEFKMNKKIHPFEIYENDPAKVESKELQTRICFPCK